MISGKIGVALALFVAVIVIMPSITVAYSTALDSRADVIFDLRSVNEGFYDEMVNVADESAPKNYETWDPAPQGIWIGSSTQESLYKLGIVTSNNTELRMTWTAMFTSQQIMSGASKFTLRLPLYIDASVKNIHLWVYEVANGTAHELQSGVVLAWGDESEPVTRYYRSLDPTDTAMMDGNDVFVRDNRMYILMTMPIWPGQIYVFDILTIYEAEASMRWYWAPNDVANDVYINTWFGYQRPVGLSTENYEARLDLDPGASYDFTRGMGGGMSGIDLYLTEGDKIRFLVYAPYMNGLNGHHTLTLPFRTENGTARFAVKTDTSDPTAIDIGNTTYYDMILASSGSAVTVEEDIISVLLTSAWNQEISFFFEAAPDIEAAPGNKFTWINQDTYDPNRTDVFIGFRPYYSYLICPSQIATPTMAEPPSPETTSWDWLYFIPVVGTVLAWVHVGEAVAKTFDIRGPGEAWVHIATYGSPVGWAWWLLSELSPQIPSPIEAWRMVRGFIDNAIDAALDFLRAVGSFIWSIGEWIYDFLTMAFDVLIEYGAIILGLLIVAVAMALFFFPLLFVIRIMTAFLLMAQGKFEAAASAGLRASTQYIESVSPTKRIKKAGKFLGKVLK